MKLRHKATGIELEVKKLLQSQPYYITAGGSMIHVDDPAFELVPEEVWEDVTEHCEVGTLPILDDGRNTVVHRCDGGISYDVLNPFQLTENYRVKKIDGLHHGPAFIVERRKES